MKTGSTDDVSIQGRPVVSVLAIITDALLSLAIRELS